MKKHIKSLVLIGIISLQSLTVSALGIRDFLQCFDFTAHEAKQVATHAVAVAAVGTAANLGYSAYQNVYTYAFQEESDRSYYKTAAELSHLAKNSQLDDDIAKILQDAKDTKSACKFIMISGDTGSGKSTTAEMIAHHVQATGLYTIPKSRLSAKTKNFMGKTDDDNKIAVLCDIADQLSATTPVGEKIVIDLEEFGTEFLATGPNVEAWRTFTGDIMGDGDRAPKYPNIIFVATSNVDETKPNQQLDPAIAGRTLQKKLNNPNHNNRINFFKNCTINIEANAQKNAREQIASAGKPVPTIFEYIQSFMQPKAYYAAEQKRKNDFLQKNMLVTDDMLTKAHNQHEDQIEQMQTAAKELKTPWTLASLIIPSARYNYQVRNARAKDIEVKIKNIQRQGYTPEIVTHNLEDMTAHDCNFLATKTKTINKQETGKRKLNEVCMKHAQTQEIKFINAIKEHTDDETNGLHTGVSIVTADSNPKLWDMMNNHRKYCSPALSHDKNAENKKAIAKLPANSINKYVINPTTRTYSCITKDDSEISDASSEPIEFGTITKAHLAAAAYGDDFASYNKKDEAASKIGKAWKANREKVRSPVERKKSLQNAPAID